MNKLQTDKLADRVKEILERHPKSRNNNRLVQYFIWQAELRLLGTQDFMTFYLNGDLSSAEGIRRRIPEVKKVHPHLRGRDTTGEEESMKKDLGYPVNKDGQFELL